MQDDSIVKNQQLANQKFAYNKKHDSLGQDQNFKRKKANKGKQRKKHHSNASGLLSFKIEQKEHIPSRISKPAPRFVSDITLNPYYRYSVLPGNYRDYHLDPSLSIDWDMIKKVHILADSEAKCPICLENSLLAARANKCGHYYCWPCVIRYLWLAQGAKKCPVCNDSLRPLDLRPASLYIYQNLSEGVVAEFSLMKRPKGTICVFRQGENIEPTFDSFPASSSKSSFLNRISIYTDFEEDYMKDKNALVAACLEADEFEKNSIQRALELLEKMKADGMQRCEFTMNRFVGGFYYFYQLCDTQPYFLHPLNVSMMKKQFNEFELFPLTLKAKVIEIERVYITEHDQRRHGQLTHLSTNAIAYFVEVDLKDICDDAIFEYFKEELIKRENARKRFKRIEDKIQAKISRRRKGEEEANNLLISYFDNPVIATVKSLPPKPVFEQKIQEIVEEEKVESKTSIWSNFSEVLKRPPREKLKFPVQMEKKEEDEDEDEEGPIKLTLFDLIKPRNNS